MKTYSATISYPLEGLALLARAQNQMERAARLFGAAEGLYSPVRFAMSTAERAEHDEAIASVRSALGKEAFSVLYQEGRSLSLQEAVSYARSET
jgi:non-specific serine/threonine protein kinase